MNKKVLLIIVVLFLLFVSLFGFLYYKNKREKEICLSFREFYNDHYENHVFYGKCIYEKSDEM